MLTAKPTILTKLTEGKWISAFDGFAETFNWLVDFCANLHGDNRDGEGNIDVEEQADGSYQIKLVSGSSAPTAGVASLNNITGDVTITGGGASHVTQEGNVITVTSTDTDTGYTSITINAGSGITVVPNSAGRSISFDISAHYI